MVCGNFILPEPASYVFFYAFFNLRNLLYIIDLRNELKAERSHSFDQSMKLSELERRCKRAEKLLSKIPQEELDKLLPKQKGLER